MADVYTLEEAQAYFAEKGLDFTPAVEAELRSLGKIADPDPVLGVVPTDRDPRLADPTAIPVNPEGGQNRYDPGHPLSRFLNSMADTAIPFAGFPANPAGPPESTMEKVASGAGMAAGFALPFGALGKAVSPIGGAIRAGMAGTKYARMAPVLANAVTGGASLGAYGASAPGTPMERIENFASGANMGVGFGAAQGIPVLGKLLSGPVTKYPANAALMAGVEAAHGGDPIVGAAMGGALPLLHATPPRAEQARTLRQSPADMEVPKTDGGFRARRAELLGELEAANREPIPNNRSSEVATELLNTGDVPAFVEGIKKNPVRSKPTKERIDELSGLVDRRRDYGGPEADTKGISRGEEAKRMAQRELVPQELADWTDAQAEIVKGGGKSSLGNIPSGSMQGVDWRRAMQGMGGGEVGEGNLLDKHIVRPNEQAHLMTIKVRELKNAAAAEIFKGFKEGGPEDMALGRAMSLKETKRYTRGQTFDEFWASEKGAEILSTVPTAEGRAMVMKALKAIKPFSVQMQGELNDMSVAFGGDKVGNIDAYLRTIEKKPGAFDLREKFKQAKEAKHYSTREAAGKAKLFNPAELKRRGSEIDQDFSAMRSMDDYLRHFSESAGHQLALSNNMPIADYFESKGFIDAAENLRNYSQSAYNRQPYGLNRSISQYANSGSWRGVAGETARWHVRRFNEAVFTANIGWNLVVQPSSSALAAGHGVKPGLKALETMTDPTFRKFVDNNVYAQQMKGMKKGGMVTQGESGDIIGGSTFIPETPGQKFKRSAQRPSSIMEQETGYYAAATAFHQAKIKGLSQRETVAYMSDRIAKTQSMYDRYNRPELLNSQELRGIVPAQSFIYEMKNNAREQFGGKLGTYKEYDTLGQRTGYGARFAAAAAIATAAAKILAGRDLFGPGSFVPYWSQLTGTGISDGAILPAAILNDLSRIPKDIAAGRYGDAFNRISRHYLPGGVQIGRVAQTIQNRTDVGKYKIKESEIPKSLVFGPFSTGSAEEYYDKSGDRMVPEWWPEEWTPEPLRKTPAEQEIPPAASRARSGRGRSSGRGR